MSSCNLKHADLIKTSFNINKYFYLGNENRVGTNLKLSGPTKEHHALTSFKPNFDDFLFLNYTQIKGHANRTICHKRDFGAC